MFRKVCAAALLAGLAACLPPQDGEEDVTGADGEQATPDPAPDPAAPPDPPPVAESNGARSVVEQTDDYLFKFSYPSEAGAIPALAALLDRRLDARKAELARESATARQTARDDGFPYNKHSYDAEWKVVADLPGWLSLSSEFSTYSGGAHGMHGVSSLIWDKKAGRAMRGVALFVSPDALGEALGDRYCEGLNRERAKRGLEMRDPDAPENDEAVFPACPGVDELTVLVGSANGRTFDRLTLYAGPYVAGSYAEGSYEVDLPVDAAVLDAVRPEYRTAFIARN